MKGKQLITRILHGENLLTSDVFDDAKFDLVMGVLLHIGRELEPDDSYKIVVSGRLPDNFNPRGNRLRIASRWPEKRHRSAKGAMRQIRKQCLHFLAHELDEALFYNEERVFDPHSKDRWTNDLWVGKASV